jgi:hypothetical protein
MSVDPQLAVSLACRQPCFRAYLRVAETVCNRHFIFPQLPTARHTHLFDLSILPLGLDTCVWPYSQPQLTVSTACPGPRQISLFAALQYNTAAMSQHAACSSVELLSTGHALPISLALRYIHFDRPCRFWPRRITIARTTAGVSCGRGHARQVQHLRAVIIATPKAWRAPRG